MKFKNRLMVFFLTYVCFVTLFFFWATFYWLMIPILGLIYLAIGGKIYDRFFN